MAVSAEQMSRAFVHENELIAVAVTGEMIHRAVGVPHAQLDMRIAQKRNCLPGGSMQCGEPGSVERPWLQRPLEGAPGGRRMAVMHLCRRSVEAFAPELALVAAGRQIGVRLTRGGAFNPRQRNPST